MTKVIVYTAVIGGIDKLWSVLPGSDDVKHIAFVDSRKREVGLWGGKPPRILGNTGNARAIKTWDQVLIHPDWDARRTARHFKAVPQRYLPEADIWIWVDGNVRARKHPMNYIKRFPENQLLTFKHWDRSCLYVEAAFCAKIRKDKKDTLTKQVNKYRKAGMPAKWGLPATRVVIRHNNQAIRDLNEAWWQEIKNHSVRDQVSLPFVCWRAGIRWDVLPGKCVAGDKGEFQYIKHRA